MVHRFIHGPDGSLRVGRLVLLLGTTILMAIFGTAGIWVTPRISDNGVARVVWVLFTTAALKLPLIFVLWSFIRRNPEWPGKPVKWGEAEVAAILEHLSTRAEEAELLDNRDAHLAYLSREAWNVADHVTGPAKVDALTVALRIDERLMQTSTRDTVE